MRRRSRISVLALTVCLLALSAVPPAHASGRLARCTASVSSHAPRQYSTVVVKSRALDAAGNPVSGAKVTFVWYLKTGRLSETRYTGSTGHASSSRNIRNAAAAYKVVVTARAASGGVAKSAFRILGKYADNSKGPATVNLPALMTGTYEFTCGMGHLVGHLVVNLGRPLASPVSALTPRSREAGPNACV